MSNEKNPFQDATQVTPNDTNLTATFKKVMSGVVRAKDEIIDAGNLNYKPVKDNVFAPILGDKAVKEFEEKVEATKRGDLVGATKANVASAVETVNYLVSRGGDFVDLMKEGAKTLSNGGFVPPEPTLPKVAKTDSKSDSRKI